MWTRRSPLFATLLLVVACAEPAEEPATETEAVAPTDEEAIAALADYWQTHYNMQHPDMVADKYAADAWVAPAEGGWYEGREQVQGWLAGNTAASPTVEITPGETVILGEHALGMGSYAVSTTDPDGNPVSFSGTYMNRLQKIDGEWAIVGSMSNYDAPPPEGWEWGSMPEGDAPPDIDNELSELVADFQAAFNAGDAAAVAGFYADGAKAAFSNGPVRNGPAEIEAGMAERMGDPVNLAIHQVDAGEITSDLWGSGGWYEMTTPDGSTVQTGLWWNIVRMTDGTPEILWTMTNAFPMEM